MKSKIWIIVLLVMGGAAMGAFLLDMSGKAAFEPGLRDALAKQGVFLPAGKAPEEEKVPQLCDGFEMPCFMEAGLVNRMVMPSASAGGQGDRVVPAQALYRLTPLGQEVYAREGDQSGFKAGKYELLAIQGISTRTGPDGRKLAEVSYTCRVIPESVPEWAQLPDMRKAFAVLQNPGAVIAEKARFVQSDKGWVCEDPM
jgi:hypothetical protein